MAQNETWLNHDLMNPVKVQYLDGNLFSMDNAGNLIGVVLTRDGVDYSGGGSISANVIRSDGGTVAVFHRRIKEITQVDIVFIKSKIAVAFDFLIDAPETVLQITRHDTAAGDP